MPKHLNVELEEIERDLKTIQTKPAFHKLLSEYQRLLDILGNVEGDEMIALFVVAYCNVIPEMTVISEENDDD